jgi:hypothetical protein
MRNKNCVILLSIFVLSSFPISVYSTEYAEGVFSGEVKYKCKDDRPRSQKEYDSALKSAKVQAIRNWAAKGSASGSVNFLKFEEEILSNPDKYLLNTEIMQKCNKKSFRLLVSGQIDVNRIRLLGKTNEKPVTRRKKTKMVAVFVARKASNVKVFDDKVTKIDSNSNFTEGSEATSFSGSSATSEGYSSQKNVTQSGGSTEIKSDIIKWDVFESKKVAAAVNQQFSSYGFRVADPDSMPEQIERYNDRPTTKKYLDANLFNLEQFISDYSSADGLSSKTSGNAKKALSYLNIPVFVFGTLDVGKKSIDPKTGKVMVNATVTATVQYFYEEDWWWETIASVEPKQYSGLGIDEMSAETNALIRAAKAASNEIVQQLNAAGIN